MNEKLCSTSVGMSKPLKMLLNVLERFTQWKSPELPTLPTALEGETCVKKGLCPISPGDSGRRRNIYYEIHGDLKASQKLVLIMGMNFTCSAWSEQVEHFGKKHHHAVLVFDNRGCGNSDAGAVENYKTSDMAKDTLTLLNWLGWDQDRSLHLCGVSLGGMIAQELCLLIPKKFKSLTLISTRCGSEFDCPSKKSWGVVFKTASHLITDHQELDLFLDCLFPIEHIDQTTEEGQARRRILRENLRNCHFLPRKQTNRGLWGHFYAANMHHCSYEKLNQMASDLRPAKIVVMTGDSDEIIKPKRAIELHQHLPGSELIVIKNAGHALGYQIPEEFNAILERTMNEGNVAFASTSKTEI